LGVGSGGNDLDLVGGSWLETDEGEGGGLDVVDGGESGVVGSLVSQLEARVSESSWDIPDETSDSLLGLTEVTNVGDGGQNFSGSGRSGSSRWDGSSSWGWEVVGVEWHGH